MRKTLILILMIIILLLLTSWANAGQYYRAIIHTHTRDSDGQLTEKKLVEESLDRYAKVLIISNHLSCIVGKCNANDHKHPKTNFAEEYFGFGKNDKFKVFQKFQGAGLGRICFTRDAEIFTNIDSAHILFLNLDSAITNSADFKTLNWREPQEIVGYIKANNGISILAHPHWMKEQVIPNGLDAIEFFNTKGYNLTDGFGKFENAEQIDLRIYNDLIKKYLADPDKNTLPTITGGCDIHAVTSELNFGQTFFWTNEPTVPNLYQAIRNGQTFANMGSGCEIKIKNINYPPDKTYINQVESTVRLTGELSVKIDPSAPTGYIKLFRDGQEIDKKLMKLYGSIFTLNFIDKPPKGRHVYFLYSPIRFISSPIIFQVNKSVSPDPRPNILPPTGPAVISNTQPSISPDGRWVAFVNNQHGNNEIFIVNIQSKEVRRLTNNSANDVHPTWHPNCQEVIFQSDRNDKNNIWSVNIFDTNLLKCYTQFNSNPCASPLLSPYNRLHYYEGGELKYIDFPGYPSKYRSRFITSSGTIQFFTKDYQLVAKNKSSGAENKLTENNINVLTGHVPNFLLYYTNRNGNFDIYAMREDGQQDLPMIVMPGDQKYATGAIVNGELWITFESNHQTEDKSQFDIYLLQNNGKIIRLTHGDSPFQ